MKKLFSLIMVFGLLFSAKSYGLIVNVESNQRLIKYCIDGYKFIYIPSGNVTQVYEIQNNKSLPAKCEKIYRKAPNGKIIEFPKDTSEKEIKEYLALPEYQIQIKLPEDLKKE